MSVSKFVALYTHQKTKKRKTWQDGYVVFTANKQARLYDDRRKQLDSVFLPQQDVHVGAEFEMDRFLVTIEATDGPKSAAEAAVRPAPYSVGGRQLVSRQSEGAPAPAGGKRRRVGLRGSVSSSSVTGQTAASDGSANGKTRSGFRAPQRVAPRVAEPRAEAVRPQARQPAPLLLSTRPAQPHVPTRTPAAGSVFEQGKGKGPARPRPDRGQPAGPSRSNGDLLALLTSGVKPSAAALQGRPATPQQQRQQQLPRDLSFTSPGRESQGMDDDTLFLSPDFKRTAAPKASSAAKRRLSTGDLPAPGLPKRDKWALFREEIELQEAGDGGSGDEGDGRAVTVRPDGLVALDRLPAPKPRRVAAAAAAAAAPTVRASSTARQGAVQLQRRVSSAPVCAPGGGGAALAAAASTAPPQPGRVALKRIQPQDAAGPLRPTASSAAKLPKPPTSTGLTARRHGVCKLHLTFPYVPDWPPLAPKPSRKARIPPSFATSQDYKETLILATEEQVQVQLTELAIAFHNAASGIQVADMPGDGDGAAGKDVVRCKHGKAVLRAVKKAGKNKGRMFYACGQPREKQCGFFLWKDQETASDGSARTRICIGKELDVYFGAKQVSLYSGCAIGSSGSGLGYGKNRGFGGGGNRTTLRLVLSRREKASQYGKGDLWVVSSTIDFDERSTFLATSAFFGPDRSSEIELSPITRDWKSKFRANDTLFAIHAMSLGMDLQSVDNICAHVTTQSMPLLPWLLSASDPTTGSVNKNKKPRFRDPLRRGKSIAEVLAVPATQVSAIAQQFIAEYSLNEDQKAVLLRSAALLGQPEAGAAEPSPLVLVHGVFGSGKSLLIAVTLLFTLKLLEASEAITGQKPRFKILVSSTTNVAVDRILQCLLDLGCTDFVRVGSAKKIAKAILPYSTCGSHNDKQELKDLKEMLKGDLTQQERVCIRESIEQMRKGNNKRRLKDIPIVGVTCCASGFPVLDSMQFPLLLLDECCQMTEASSLLPMARFKCEMAVLVGDPKQLSPTITGPASEHGGGLEQTMFDRLALLGHKPIMLRTQYRCHPKIASVANNLFYNHQLRDGVRASDRTALLPLADPLMFFDVANGREKQESDNSFYNEAEASLATALVAAYLEGGVEAQRIGVITLYRSQAQRIKGSLDRSPATKKASKAVQVSTVDAFQGGEKDVIVLSCVRTAGVGFIDSLQRTNVALTRAKRHLAILGHRATLLQNRLWSAVLQHCVHRASSKFLEQVELERLHGAEAELMEASPVKESHAGKRAGKAAAADVEAGGPPAATDPWEMVLEGEDDELDLPSLALENETGSLDHEAELFFAGDGGAGNGGDGGGGEDDEADAFFASGGGGFMP